MEIFLLNNLIILSVISSVLFATGSVIGRVGLIDEDPLVGSAISIFGGTIFLSVLISVLGQFNELLMLDLSTIVILSVAGLLNFAGGRWLLFYSTKIIGISRTILIQTLTILFSALLAWLFIDYTFSIRELIAISLMTSRISLIPLSKSSIQKVNNVSSSYFMKGVFVAIVGAFIVALSSILISLSIDQSSSIYSELFIFHFSASIVWLIPILIQKKFTRLFYNTNSRTMLALHGAIMSLGHLSRYFAIVLGSVVIVQAVILSISPVLTIILSYVFLNRIENVNRYLWFSTLLAILGIYLVS